MPFSRRGLLRGAPALGLAAWGALRAPPAHAVNLKVGAAAPPATLMTLDGTRLSTAELRGQVVILTFWATWCVPCRAELPLLSAYAERHASEGLHVLGFSLDSADRLDQVFELARSLSFPVGLLSRSDATGYGRMWRIPVNFTLDAAGRLIDDGWQDKAPTWTEERLNRIVTPLLTRAAAS